MNVVFPILLLLLLGLKHGSQVVDVTSLIVRQVPTFVSPSRSSVHVHARACAIPSSSSPSLVESDNRANKKCANEIHYLFFFYFPSSRLFICSRGGEVICSPAIFRPFSLYELTPTSSRCRLCRPEEREREKEIKGEKNLVEGKR